MTRLRICAFGAFTLISTTAFAQDAQADPAGAGHERILLGQDKVAPLCPEFCEPLRVTSPEQATVGEREVLSYTMAAATSGSKLRVDSGRSLWAQAEKFPRLASPEQPSSMVTQGAFRPALDPVLAEPTEDQTE